MLCGPLSPSAVYMGQRKALAAFANKFQAPTCCSWRRKDMTLACGQAMAGRLACIRLHWSNSGYNRTTVLAEKERG